MVEELDGSKNDWGWCKSNLGANAILAVSLATARAGAAFVTGGASLAIFLISESIGIGGLVTSCRN